MNRWSRSRAVPPMSARLADIAARLGVGVPPHADADDIVDRIDAAVDRLQLGSGDSARLLELHRAAMEAAPVPLVLMDESGNPIVCSSRADALLEGGAAAIVPGRFLQDLVRRASMQDEPHHDVVEVFGPPRRTISLMGVPLPSGEVPHPVLVFLEDTTEWRRAELARRDLVTNISHELRTPVGAIALLAETIAGEDDLDTIRRLATRLEGEANRLASTLHDVLALSRLEAAGPGDRDDLDLSDLVRFCIARLRPTAENVGIELVDAGIAAGLSVHADRQLLMTAIDNLLDNAVKYSDKGEPVRVAVRRVTRPDGDFAEVIVEDGGIGIPMRERQRIFERFYRVDRARSRDTGGSGLGLAIVRHVAVVHDGNVEVDSLEGVGSTFTLRIPLRCADDEMSDVAAQRNDDESNEDGDG